MSVFQRVYGFFTFVNIMWVLAIIGITVSIGPALWVILRPIRELFGFVKFYHWKLIDLDDFA